jgi:hypothetical protein
MAVFGHNCDKPLFTKKVICGFRHDVATVIPHSDFNKRGLTISIDIRVNSNDPGVARGQTTAGWQGFDTEHV